MPTERKIGWFLEELCTELGFCLPASAAARLCQAPPSDADEFTRAVFRLEGLDPAADRNLYSDVRGRVERLFSSSDERAG